MLKQQVFEAWAPAGAVWSPWAKPVLFASIARVRAIPVPRTTYDTDWLQRDSHVALIVNLPGPESIWFATHVLAHGYRPVPLFNGCPGPNSVIPTTATIAAIACVTHEVARAPLADDAPPAFLLDGDRQFALQSPGPGTFDNRWLVFPQDFPSGNFLKRHGIERAVLVQAGRSTVPEDLAHVLLRWQQAGIGIELVRTDLRRSLPQPITVRPPRWFGRFWYRLLTLARLRSSSTGGFGSVIPTPSSDGGYHGGGSFG